MYEIGKAEIENVRKVIESGRLFRYRGGEGGWCDRFEAALARQMGVKHALATSSGTGALACAMVGAGLGPGDEVIVPAYTFMASAEAVRRYPDRLRAYLAINPNYPEIVARDLTAFDRQRDVFVGLKLLAGYHGVAWDHAAYESAWRFAEERGLAVLGHTWGGSSLDGPEQVRKAAARYRNVRLLCGHAMHGAWDEAVAIARDLPNVYLELTGVLDTDRGAVEKFCRAGLSERVVFGTDLPWFDQHQGIGAILSAEITDEDRHNILHRNAERLLRGSAGLAF
jgi:predicted TIM-barrel fold metal-dependent hydrolase